jgi:putative restriction endonuclease
MPVSKKVLMQNFEEAARSCGWSVALTSAPGVFPARYVLVKDAARHEVIVYIWNITHGGKSRSADEFRIQITSGVSVFEFAPPALTLILGWSEERGVFAAWDSDFHTDPLGGSPSLQISGQALDAESTQGIASHRKQTGEFAIAFVPEFLGVYIDQNRELHDLGAVVAEAAVFDKVAGDPAAISDEAIEAGVSAKPRAHALRVTKVALRDIRFRRNVLAAYGHECAMCALQLRLVEAAHIVPVGHPSGTDETCNGVALCSLHHSAYDAGLIAFDENYNVLISDAKFAELAAAQRDGGAKAFKDGLRKTLRVPKASEVQPKPDYVKKANAIRGW